jgi:transposase InsO family protein
MDDVGRADAARRWGELRFAVIGPLLAAPPARREVRAALRALAAKVWQHPVDGTPVRFGLSTIERWYYAARDATDPVGALTSRARSDRGTRRALDDRLLAALKDQYIRYPNWTVKLHAINLAALVRSKPDVYGKPPSYGTVRRVMRRQGWARQRRPKTEGQKRAVERLAQREVRGFEATHVHALWHLDFHDGSLRVVDADGTWHTPQLLGILDDRSRVGCHLQWYLGEDAERLAHGTMQAMLKRGLPRAIMHDNGAAMRSAEFQQGLVDLGIESRPTLAYSPYQNGKQETFWAIVESRLLAMLQRVERLDLATLNRATQAWLEGEYHREVHEGIGVTPLDRLTEGPSVVREAPTMERLRLAFTQQVTRRQRRSDGTVSIEGVRFEIPSHLRTLQDLTVRYRRWDLSDAWVVDPRTKAVLARIVPVDLARNADGRRKPLAEPSPVPELLGSSEADPFPPRLRELMEAYAADGLPPAYLPRDESPETR